MKNDKSLGCYGEELAAQYLLNKGYKILERNYRNHFGELDIIAWDKEFLVIIEVKTRKSSKYGKPREAVDVYKQENIIRVTHSYLAEKSLWSVPVRFDVIEIFLKDRETIEHLEGAFQVE
ncbi:MAG: YraN family protein [Tissierellia bacterium]|nr:YraN family protein [Tissierellia bacterium]